MGVPPSPPPGPRPGVENNGAHKIEMVQRSAARWTLKSITIPLASLTCSRTSAGGHWSKIHHGHVPINAFKYLRPMTRRSRHSHSDSYIPLSTSTSSHRLSFYPRTITQWNSLPRSIFHNNDLTSFKHSVSSISHSPVN